jgi:hypothetical protein
VAGCGRIAARHAAHGAGLLELVQRMHRGALDLAGHAGGERAVHAQAIRRRKRLDRQQPLEQFAKIDGLLLHGASLPPCRAAHSVGPSVPKGVSGAACEAGLQDHARAREKSYHSHRAAKHANARHHAFARAPRARASCTIFATRAAFALDTHPCAP